MKCIYTEKMDGLLDSMMIASIVDGGWELRKSYKVGQALQVEYPQTPIARLDNGMGCEISIHLNGDVFFVTLDNALTQGVNGRALLKIGLIALLLEKLIWKREGAKQ